MGLLKSSDTRSGSPKPQIFLVDDEPMLLELAERILESFPFEVRSFTNPREALEAMGDSKPPPDLIVTDYAMAGLNGQDVIREARRMNPKQKVLLVSGTVDESIFRDSPDKPNLFLAKPYMPNQLVEAIESLLAS